MTIVTNQEVWILTLVMNVEIPLKFQRQAFVRFKFMILSTISDLKYLDNRYFYYPYANTIDRKTKVLTIPAEQTKAGFNK